MKVSAVSRSRDLRLPWERGSRQEPFWRQNGNDIFGEPLIPFPISYSGSSFRLQLVFKLTTPFYSGRDRAGREKTRGDNNDPTVNNHLCRDWLSGIPIAKAGGWKRLFRRLWPDEDTETQLFGPADMEEGDDGACRGELKFHHSLFPGADVTSYLIAPRNEEKGIVEKPVTYEILKPGGRCRLVIDYLPRKNDKDITAMVLENLVITAREKISEDAIGGKSTVWGRIRLVRCQVQAGPDIDVSPEIDCLQESA